MTHPARSFTRFLRPLAAIPVLLLPVLSSCLPLPLGDPQHSQVDPHLSGFWKAARGDDKGMALLIAPFDSHACLVEVANYTKTGDKYHADSTPFKAWLTDVKGSRFLTCQLAACLADARLGDNIYPTFRIELKGHVLTARMLKEDYSKFKDLHDPAALAKVVEENLDDPAMYREPMEFHRLNPNEDADKPFVQLFFRAFGS